MVILEFENHSLFKNRIIIVLGIGLIGSSISRLLLTFSPQNTYQYKIDWLNVNLLELQLSNYFQSKNYNDSFQIDWVWSAGKSGFYSTDAQIKNEYNFFELFIFYIKEKSFLHDKNTPFFFHFISSAGGLFEGQLNVTLDSIELPLRPYGRLKLMQERLINSVFPDSSCIYRASTVFGISSFGHRAGLISTLVQNSFYCKMTNIQGDFDSKRDYVWVEDLSMFVVNLLIFKELKLKQSLYYIISGKPTTIFEIVHLIQKITHTKVLFKFDTSFSNSQPIVFSSNLKPKNLRSTPLDTAVRIIYQNNLMSHK